MHDPFSVTPRRRFSAKERWRIFRAHDGICSACHLPIDPLTQKWILEHETPLAMDGTNDDTNLGVTHEKCARIKTSTEAKTRAKIRRTALKMYGAKKAKRPMMGSKASGWKKKIDGTVIRRDKG